MKHLIMFLAEGFEEVEAVTVIDLLRRAGIKVTTVALVSEQVRGAHGITLLADTVLPSMPKEFDGVILPGGQPGTRNLAASETVREVIRTTHKAGCLCAAICAAPSVLAKAGILENVRVTCFPGVEEELGSARFIEAAVVRDGMVVTGRSAGTAVQFALELIAVVTGQDAADRIRKQIHY